VIGSAKVALRPRQYALERGHNAYERGDYAASLREWSRAASQGDPEALYRLGLLHARGHGVLANLADAAAYYRRAAEHGHAEAQHQLSLLHLEGYRARLTSFARWYAAAAERDQEAADRNQALLFPHGFDVPQDPAAALRWSRAAAEQGIADAQANSGLIYARGIGCEPDYEEAHRWYHLAAEQGNTAAELGLVSSTPMATAWRRTFRQRRTGTERQPTTAMLRRKWRWG